MKRAEQKCKAIQRKFQKPRRARGKGFSKDFDNMTTTTKPSLHCLQNKEKNSSRKSRALRLSRRAVRTISFEG